MRVDTDKGSACKKGKWGAARGIDSRIKQGNGYIQGYAQNVTIGNTDAFQTEDERVYTTAMIQGNSSRWKDNQTGQEPDRKDDWL